MATTVIQNDLCLLPDILNYAINTNQWRQVKDEKDVAKILNLSLTESTFDIKNRNNDSKTAAESRFQLLDFKVWKNQTLCQTLLDLLQWSLKRNFSDTQIHCLIEFYVKLHTTFQRLSSDRDFPNVQTFIEMCKLALLKCTNKANVKKNPFTTQQLESVANYVIENYIQHIRLISYVYQKPRIIQVQKMVKKIESSELLTSKLPLKEAFPEDVWLRKKEDLAEQSRQKELEIISQQQQQLQEQKMVEQARLEQQLAQKRVQTQSDISSYLNKLLNTPVKFDEVIISEFEAIDQIESVHLKAHELSSSSSIKIPTNKVDHMESQDNNQRLTTANSDVIDIHTDSEATTKLDCSSSPDKLQFTIASFHQFIDSLCLTYMNNLRNNVVQHIDQQTLDLLQNLSKIQSHISDVAVSRLTGSKESNNMNDPKSRDTSPKRKDDSKNVTNNDKSKRSAKTKR